MRFKIYMHLFSSWMLAHLLHPVMTIVFIFFNDPQEMIQHGFSFGDLWILTISAVFLSIPVLIVSLIGLRTILLSSLRDGNLAFFAWCTVVVLSLMLGGCFLILLFFGEVVPAGFKLLLPAISACMIAILLRYESFIKLFFLMRKRSVTNRDHLLTHSIK